MRQQAKSPFGYFRSIGFSIVELMVAILIGLIILAGVIQVVVTSKSTFLGQEEMSFIQENARYAVDLIGKDLQSAGYLGCAGNAANVAYVAKVDAGSADLLGVEYVRGFEGKPNGIASNADFPPLYGNKVLPINQPGTTTVQDYPDSFIVRGGSGTVVPVDSQSGLTFTLESNPGFSDGEHIALVAEDCRRAAIVRAATVSGSAFTLSDSSVCNTSIKPVRDQNFVCNAACSCSGESSNELFQPGSVAMSYSTHAYYIADSGVLPGVPALKRSVLHGADGDEEELALGVEDMEVLYGIVVGGNLRYTDAAQIVANGWSWGNVSSVQVSLLMRSQAISANQAQSRTYLGNNYNDRFMRQVVTSTFRLRNGI
ncbi:MAG TPA: PilW family protein [Cellvibrio sp.]|nr:PilW family protein [Cellvibrio sp.]